MNFEHFFSQDEIRFPVPNPRSVISFQQLHWPFSFPFYHLLLSICTPDFQHFKVLDSTPYPGVVHHVKQTSDTWGPFTCQSNIEKKYVSCGVSHLHCWLCCSFMLYDLTKSPTKLAYESLKTWTPLYKLHTFKSEATTTRLNTNEQR